MPESKAKIFLGKGDRDNGKLGGRPKTMPYGLTRGDFITASMAIYHNGEPYCRVCENAPEQE